MADSNIAYLSHAQIDKAKWDACIRQADNGLIYAMTFYLDTTAQSWDALILNDYEAIMPLPIRKKWIFRYLFEPPMTPVLGIFGNNIDATLVDKFLQSIPGNLRFWDYSLNHFNPVSSNRFPVFKRNNFVLPLNRSYETIQEAYHENIRRNNRKALKMGCVVKKNISIDQVIAICKKEFPRFTTVQPGLFEGLKKIFLHAGQQAVTYGVESEKGQLLASAAFIIFNKRAYYWLVGNEPESRKYGASALLIDAFIRDFHSQPLIFDFEGSDTAGVADFYRKFGAKYQPFTTIFHNRLPVPFRWYKHPPKHYQPLTSSNL